MDNEKKPTLLVPPQLPPFLANVFQLKPIFGTPSSEQVKLVHEAIRALGSLLHTPELKDTGLSIELSQYLFDIQMVCHRQKYPITILSNEVVYDPPNLPNYIPIELKPVIGYPSNAEVSSVHTAFRISESFANVPSIFDPYLHSQLSQHLFDIQLARHVQRSMIKHFTPSPVVSEGSAPHKITTDDNDGGDHLGAQAQEATEATELQIPTAKRVDLHDKGIRNPELGESGNLCRTNKLMTEIRDTLKNMNRVLIASQNSLARGLNSSAWHECGYDLGAHTLVNENGELPEAHNLPSFQQERSYTRSFLPARALTEDALAQYLRFYNMGEEVLEEGQLSKIKPGMIEDAKNLLAQYVGSRHQQKKPCLI